MLLLWLNIQGIQEEAFSFIKTLATEVSFWCCFDVC